MIQKDHLWKDAKGQTVPMQYVPKADIAKEKLVDKVSSRMLNLQKKMADLKQKLLIDLGHYMNSVEDSNEAKTVLIYSFDRSIKIEFDRDNLHVRLYDLIDGDYAMVNLDFQNTHAGQHIRITRNRKKKSEPEKITENNN